ncbi:hypothetical protein SCLARK_00635 [Spiroplasma clarkii]|nr:hypothetical protein SCLARK_00635 [Spiroplasma clarkii]
MGWNDVVVHSFNLIEKLNETKLESRLKFSLKSLQHYNKREKYSRILIFFDNDRETLCEMYERLETEIHNILSEEFNNLKKAFTKLKYLVMNVSSTFLPYFVKTKLTISIKKNEKLEKRKLKICK